MLFSLVSVQDFLRRSRLVFLGVVLAMLAAPLSLGSAHAQSAGAPQARAEAASIVLEGEDARLRLTFYRPDVARVDWQVRRSGAGFTGSPDTSLAVIRTPGEAAARPDVQSTETQSGDLLLRTEQLTAQVEREPLRVRFFDGDGQPLVGGAPEGGFTARDTAQALRFAIGPETRFYGTGERSGPLNLCGRAFRSYNTPQFGYVEAPSVMKINVPLLTTSGGYALFFDSPWPGRFDIGAARTNRLQYTAANQQKPARGSLTYYLIAGETPRQQLEGYTWLTGR